jgi:hypothetical protein
MIERREYVSRIKAAMDVWSDELLLVEQHVIEGDTNMVDIWEQQRQEMMQLLTAIEESINCLRHQKTVSGSSSDIAWRKLNCNLVQLERLYPGN